MELTHIKQGAIPLFILVSSLPPLYVAVGPHFPQPIVPVRGPDFL